MMRSKARYVLILATAFCVLTAAAGLSSAEPPTKLVPLVQGGPQQGTFHSQYLTIKYDYTFSQNQLTVSGKLKFADSLTMNYPGLQQFYIEVVLLNAQGGLIERRNVHLKTAYKWGEQETLAASAFKAQFSVPAQTAGMAFYYNGVTQAGVRDGGGTSFWYDPVHGAK